MAEEMVYSVVEDKGSLPLNGTEGDWKMAFICHTPNSDSDYSISQQQKKKKKNQGAALFITLKVW